MSAAVLGSWVVLSAFLLAACAFDLRARRIPNALSVAAGLAGVLLHTLLPEGSGLFAATQRGGLGAAQAALGLLVALAAGLALWRARLFGAGDAKLLAAVGAYTGVAGVLPVVIFSLLSGGVLALCWAAAAVAGVAPATLQAAHAEGVSRPRAQPQAQAPEARAARPRQLPYALALSAGTLAHAAAACGGLYRG